MALSLIQELAPVLTALMVIGRAGSAEDVARIVSFLASDRAAYVHQLRLLRRDLPERRILKLLVEQIAPLCKDRPGGYTRILRDAKNQLGDNAPRAIWEFVDRPDMGDEGEEVSKKATKRAKKAIQKAAKA